MAEPLFPTAKRRGAQVNPPNRFESTHREPDLEQLDSDELPEGPAPLPTQHFPDRTRSILSENDSPDVGFRYSINPYRGCEHGCSYCYARPTHEYLGLNAGLDFETKIFYKPRAAELLREALSRPSWQPQPIAMSGVTDCYQPIERRLRITRACLEVLWEAHQPVVIVTKNALVTRDLDLLGPMAAENLVHVYLSVTTLDPALARNMEPRTSLPAARLRTITALGNAGVPVGVMTAPIIPGLNDSEIPAVLRAAHEAGAGTAGYVLLRLPWSVRPVFLDWLHRHYPLKYERVESLIRQMRGGQLNDPHFGSRMSGTGLMAEQIRETFSVFAHKFGLDGDLPRLDCSRFRPPRAASGQGHLFY